MRSNNKGFTLIELLIVVVIIGILAAIAIPKFSEAREKAFISAMKSDLKNLATQQELYYSDNFTYSTDKAALEFSESKNVVVTVGAADTDGWGADASHSGTTVACGLFYGTSSSTNGTVAGVVRCSNETS
jgi:type IV pilus assembly protein PilA